MKTVILIINYNNHHDLVSCLASCERLEKQDFVVLILENGSSKWTKENWNWMKNRGLEEKIPAELLWSERLVYFVSQQNLGYGRGNNKGFDLIKEWGLNPKYVWLLNNDTDLEPNSLTTLENQMDEEPDLGFAGSLLLDYSNRIQIQAAGGVVLPFLGITRHLLKGKNVSDVKSWPVKYDYQCGASLMARFDMIVAYGGFSPRYFLYFEETDWQLRMHKLGWKNRLVPESKVYHHESASTKNAPQSFYFHYFGSAIIFLRNQYSIFTCFIGFLSLLGILCWRSRLNWTLVSAGLKGMWNQGIMRHKVHEL